MCATAGGLLVLVALAAVQHARGVAGAGEAPMYGGVGGGAPSASVLQGLPAFSPSTMPTRFYDSTEYDVAPLQLPLQLPFAPPPPSLDAAAGPGRTGNDLHGAAARAAAAQAAAAGQAMSIRDAATNAVAQAVTQLQTQAYVQSVLQPQPAPQPVSVAQQPLVMAQRAYASLPPHAMQPMAAPPSPVPQAAALPPYSLVHFPPTAPKPMPGLALSPAQLRLPYMQLQQPMPQQQMPFDPPRQMRTPVTRWRQSAPVGANSAGAVPRPQFGGPTAAGAVYGQFAQAPAQFSAGLQGVALMEESAHVRRSGSRSQQKLKHKLKSKHTAKHSAKHSASHKAKAKGKAHGRARHRASAAARAEARQQHSQRAFEAFADRMRFGRRPAVAPEPLELVEAASAVQRAQAPAVPYFPQSVATRRPLPQFAALFAPPQPRTAEEASYASFFEAAAQQHSSAAQPPRLPAEDAAIAQRTPQPTRVAPQLERLPPPPIALGGW